MAMALSLSADRRGFAVNGRATFLMGASYLAALGADDDAIQEDLVDLKRYGVNLLRVAATWTAYGQDVSALDADGDERPPYFQRLGELCGLAETLGFVVEVVLSRDDGFGEPGVLTGDEAHLNAAAVLAEGLKDFRGVCFDLARDRNAAGARGVEIALVRRLRDRVKELDPGRLVTASHAGDIDPDRLLQYLTSAGVDYVAPHRPSGASSPAETQRRTGMLLRRMGQLGKVVPLHYGEPFRRGAGDWQPTAKDFLTDLRAAKEAGAAGWCFHNGPHAADPAGRPRRCFDLRPAEGRLIDQLEDTERTFLHEGAKYLRGEE